MSEKYKNWHPLPSAREPLLLNGSSQQPLRAFSPAASKESSSHAPRLTSHATPSPMPPLNLASPRHPASTVHIPTTPILGAASAARQSPRSKPAPFSYSAPSQSPAYPHAYSSGRAPTPRSAEGQPRTPGGYNGVKVKSPRQVSSSSTPRRYEMPKHKDTSPSPTKLADSARAHPHHAAKAAQARLGGLIRPPGDRNSDELSTSQPSAAPRNIAPRSEHVATTATSMQDIQNRPGERQLPASPKADLVDDDAAKEAKLSHTKLEADLIFQSRAYREREKEELTTQQNSLSENAADSEADMRSTNAFLNLERMPEAHIDVESLAPSFSSTHDQQTEFKDDHVDRAVEANLVDSKPELDTSAPAPWKNPSVKFNIQSEQDDVADVVGGNGDANSEMLGDIEKPQMAFTWAPSGCNPVTIDDRGLADIVQFSSASFFATEDEEQVVISLMRIGYLQEECTVEWETEDSTAKNGEKYQCDGWGTVTFQKGQDHAEISIDLLDDEYWGTAKQFKIRLRNPVQCNLGNYLHRCYVTIIDDDAFPSNRYSLEQLRTDEGIEEIPGHLLMYDFLRHCVECVPGAGRRSLIMLFGDQLHNVYYLLRTYLISMYLVDVVFAREPKGALWCSTKQQTAYMVALLLGLPVLILHYWDYYKVRMDLAGDLRSYFQTCLITKYFNYCEDERARVTTAEIQGAMRTECNEIIECGYMKCFTVLALFGKLAIVVAFVLHENPSAIWVVLLYPVGTLVWLYFRIQVLIEATEDKVSTENTVCDRIQAACERFRLISDYGHRPEVSEDIGFRIEKLNMKVLRCEILQQHNLKFTTWLSTILTVGYIALFSGHVLSGVLSLGTFLAMVKLFSELGEEFNEALAELMELAGAIGPLQKVTRFMNGQTDLADSMNNCRHDLETTLRRRRERRAAPQSTAKELDSLQFVIEGNMQFTFDSSSELEGDEGDRSSLSLNRRHSPTSLTSATSGSETMNASASDFTRFASYCTNTQSTQWSHKPGEIGGAWLLTVESSGVELPQGRMISISGDHGSGKATVLKLICGILYPRTGNIFIPAHLRVLHVSQSTQILEKSLWKNLVYGNSNPSRTRVMNIVKRLQHLQHTGDLEKQLMKELEDSKEGESLKNGDGQAWRTAMCYTEEALVHIARALIMNPEVMVLHRPISHFDERMQKHLMNLLTEHVQERGIEMGHHPKELRRPRTVIYSTDYKWAAEMADTQVVIEVKTAEGDMAKLSRVKVLGESLSQA